MQLDIKKSIRTNNFSDTKIMKKIQNLWSSVSPDIDTSATKYGVYYNYESNYRGDYTLGIAVEDNAENALSVNDNAHYQIFDVDISTDQGIPDTWRHIWQLEDIGTLKRAYTIDFEKYLPDGTVKIYIATI
ncbi:AraC family transcriptional regulator (plasmid) [Levilactobacillus brevis]|uniref:GyrI-like domain-containing protein n=1 Tax=Levilactobacillus brevis TaxID=1580 RepID=UPI000A205025|nr:effector binding domain-containing protein [Levilactobacillus brevis]ARN94150.1 AraC family transcriptional regulator [Levilactobacillus brevis]ARN96594.1 AraC family transcriptional regulator [Levilactobacillus brevis]ROS90850.1 AraC family transcriptional regulator [Muribaculaceae bacterium Isolate-077 (Janvier)]